MSVVDVLVVTGGHPFAAEPFFSMFDALEGIVWAGADRPATGYDVVVLYDMPGHRFTGDAAHPLEVSDPGAGHRRTMRALTEAGTGLVFLHHAVAGWPGWDEYGDLIGGRFLYQPGRFANRDLPDSGYLLDVEHEVEVVAADHPVCAELPARFALARRALLLPRRRGSGDAVAPHPAPDG